MSNSFTEKAEQALTRAQTIAEERGHSYIGTEHLLLSLVSIDDCTACYILKKYDITRDKISAHMSEYKRKGSPPTLSSRDTTPRLRRIIEESYAVSRGLFSEKIGTEHLLIALLEERESIAYKILTKLGADFRLIKNEAIEYVKNSEMNLKSSISGIDEAQIPNLLKFGNNMTRFAKEVGYEPTVERDVETTRVIRILTRKNKNNPCLIGEAGVGKTAIVEGLATKIANGEVPDALLDKIIISVDLTSMVAGAKYRGDFEERIKGIIKEARKFPQIILFIDEIHTIVGAGAAEGAIDAANILKPELARGDIKLIGATTISEYRKYIEKDAALERRFQSVLVEEPTKKQTLKILSSIRKRYEEYHKTVIDDDALESAVYLSSRFITDRYLPDKAIDLIDEACALVKAGEAKKAIKNVRDEKYRGNFEIGREIAPSEASRVTKEVVEDLVSEITGIDVSRKSSPDISKIKTALSERVVGQDAAIDAISKALMKSFAGLGDTNRPKGVFLFLGESGVGKTELAKALSEELFAGEDAMIRYDMTEFSEMSSVSKIIGTPPGYVGYDETNSLLEKIRLHPYSVVLLDEIEKAHPDVLSLFLNIFDEGQITDATGRKINFKNSYIILTSNIGNEAHKIKNAPGFIESDAERGIRGCLREYFSDEFINRVDEVVVFNHLKYGDLLKISIAATKKTTKRLMDLGIKCEISGAVSEHFARRNARASLGARQLIREISDAIEGNVAALVMGKEYKSDRIIFCDVEDGKLSFKVKEAVSTQKAI